MLYGWFSVKMSRLAGVSQYKTPDGKIIECTIITHNKDRTGIAWDDLVFMGEIEKFVQKISVGELDGLEEYTPENIEKLGKILRRELDREKEPHRWN